MKVTMIVLVCAALGAVLGVAMAHVQLGEANVLKLSDASAAAGSLSDTPTPRVAVDAETYDFGHMERQADQSHDFLFTNVGNAPLQLTVGETTCKCTVGEAPEGLVAPGETVPVTLNWTASTGESEFRQNATILTNDPLRQMVRLTVVGRVTEANSYYPKTLLFGDVPSGTTRTAEVQIVSFENEDLEVLETELRAPASEEYFTVEVVEMPEEEYPTPDVLSALKVRVTAQPALPFGPIGGWLKMQTNLPSLPNIEIPLAGKVVSDVSIFGRGYDAKRDVLTLGAVNGDTGREQKLYVFLHGERARDIELTLGETVPEFLELELGERKELKEGVYQIPLTLRVPPGSPPAVHLGGQDSKLGRVAIETTHPRIPELSFQVKFTVE